MGAAMAGRGPPRTPDAVLRLHGSNRISRKTGKRYDGKGVDAKPGDETPPPHLEGEALACWKETVAGLKEIGLFANTDRKLLTCYCETWARWLEDRGNLSIVAEFRRMCGELGMSPASRQRLRADVKKPNDESKAKKFFGA